MMGRREDGQGQFFYSFDLDKVELDRTCGLARNRVAFERDGLERREAWHVLGREYHAEASRGHVLQVQVVTAAVAELERFLGKTQPLYLQRDVASGALQQDSLAEVVDADQG